MGACKGPFPTGVGFGFFFFKQASQTQPEAYTKLAELSLEKKGKWISIYYILMSSKNLVYTLF